MRSTSPTTMGCVSRPLALYSTRQSFSSFGQALIHYTVFSRALLDPQSLDVLRVGRTIVSGDKIIFFFFFFLHGRTIREKLLNFLSYDETTTQHEMGMDIDKRTSFIGRKRSHDDWSKPALSIPGCNFMI
ncbi:unnamed protein product [Absidia cylindrospora]